LILTGSHFKKLRVNAQLTQRELARLVGVSQAHIARIENGKVDPRLSTVNRILQVLTEGEGRKCNEIMTKKVVFAKPTDRIIKVSELMMKEAISQLPVIQGSKIIGTVTEESIIENLHINIADELVETIMEPPLPCVAENTAIPSVRQLLEDHPGILLTHRGEVTGIITRSDLLKIVFE
jgi:predicted transcriptional regulator